MKESQFYRLFSPLSILGGALYWAFMLPADAQEVSIQLSAAVADFRISYFYCRTLPVVMGCVPLAALLNAGRNENDGRVAALSAQIH